MKVAFASAAVVVSLAVAFTDVSNAQSATKDARAEVLLTQCSAALGDPNTFMGLRVSGTVQPSGSSDQLPFVYEARGITESLFTLQRASGIEVHRQAGGHAQVRLANGQLKTKPAISVRYSWPQLIPSLICYWPQVDPSFSLQYVGANALQGIQVDHLRIQAFVPDTTGKADANEALLSGLDLYLDSSSHIPVWTTVRAFGITGIENSIPVDTYYSGYGKFQGILFPKTITEFGNGVLNRSLTIHTVEFNQTFSDANFKLERK